MLDSGVRELFRKLIKKGLTVTWIADLLDTTMQTIRRRRESQTHV